ncbi:uncharacterized protein DNG_07579 [Cephalotrichum gorgonifer]|uniref:Uncharacterized protein n=1 Tax=Cephalotrichum gorgonifer TaxID=2041049 RepID=A0AAE8N3K5_9PEZI|nr:uncharacterized protein DNG_07579 [Cephalotrichum gorgonifer]
MSPEQRRYVHDNPRQPGRHRLFKDSGAVRRPRRDGQSSAKAIILKNQAVAQLKTTTSSDRRGQIQSPKSLFRELENFPLSSGLPYQRPGLNTPPATSASHSDAGTESVIVVRPLLGDHRLSDAPLKEDPQDGDGDDDDVASQGSMRTWTGERDGVNLQNARNPGTVLFNYDPHDSASDPPPIPWEEVQSYTDFRDNKEAHAYWKWDPAMLMWTHTDADTGEVVFCPSELD